MRTMLMTLLIAACFAPVAFAQGSRSFTPPTKTGGSFANVMTTMDITAQTPLTIRRFGAASSAVGSTMVEIWIRPGGIGLDPVAPNQLPLTNWVHAGTGQIHAQAAGEIHTISVNLDLAMQANETLGICLICAGSPGEPKLLHYMHSQGLQPVHNNGDMIVNTNSWLGAYNPSSTPPFNSYYGAPSATYATIWYDAGPTVTASASALVLPDTLAGSAGDTAMYTVSGTRLTSTTTIAAPPGVEISLNPSTGFAGSLTIPTYPAYQDTTVYTRISSSAPKGAITGNLVHTSGGAPPKDVALSGNALPMTVSAGSLYAGFAVVGNAGTAATYILGGSGLAASTVVTAPAGFELAQSATGPFAGTLTLTAMNYLQPLYVRLTGAAVGEFAGQVTHTSGADSAVVTVSGDVLTPFDLRMERLGPAATAAVDNNQPGLQQLMDFSLQTLTGPWTVNGITFTATGTANADTAFAQLGLYQDHPTAGTPGMFDGPGVDALAGTFMAGFAGGSATASLINSAFGATEVRRYFLCGQLAGKAKAGETLTIDISAMNASNTSGGAISGMPTSGTVPAFQINPSHITFEVHGPESYTTVRSDAQGPGGNGHVICDLSVTPQNDSWTLNHIVFGESGSIDARDGLSFVALYLDNGNGVWDGPTIDTLANYSASTGFNGPNGLYSAQLNATAGSFAVNQSKRFFLVAKLSGFGLPGQTLRVAATNVFQTSPTFGEVQGIPTDTVPALVIDLATLSVSAGPANPQSTSTLKDVLGSRIAIGQLRLTATVVGFTVESIHLTTGGSGNWVNDIAGVEICRDSGDGVCDPSDPVLASGVPTTPGVPMLFSPALALAPGTHTDVWIVVTTTALAGGTPSATYTARVANPGDVTVTSGSTYVAKGIKEPVSGVLHVVDFGVGYFSPLESARDGGGQIIIKGSGFAKPLLLTIGGVECSGNASVNQAGTEIHGLRVPKGVGQNLEIALHTNGLEPITLQQRFSYSKIYQAEDEKLEGGGCAVGLPFSPVAALIPGMLGLWALRRRARRQ